MPKDNAVREPVQPLTVDELDLMYDNLGMVLDYLIASHQNVPTNVISGAKQIIRDFYMIEKYGYERATRNGRIVSVR